MITATAESVSRLEAFSTMVLILLAAAAITGAWCLLRRGIAGRRDRRRA